jgi:hypothetical protein
MGARLQPIELHASTAGIKTNFVGYGLFEESLGILEGRIDDPTTLVVIFAADGPRPTLRRGPGARQPLARPVADCATSCGSRR